MKRNKGSWQVLAFSAWLAICLFAAPLMQATTENERKQNGTAVESAAKTESPVPDAHAAGQVELATAQSDAKRLQVPRPTIMALIGLGLLAIGALLRRRERHGVQAASVDSEAAGGRYTEAGEPSAGRSIPQAGRTEVTGIEPGSF